MSFEQRQQPFERPLNKDPSAIVKDPTLYDYSRYDDKRY